MARSNLEILMKTIIILLTTFLLVGCSGFNFTCNDFSSELTLEENAKNLERCSKNQFQWKRSY